MKYRGYIIAPYEYAHYHSNGMCNYTVIPENYDGERVEFASTIEEAKELIDDLRDAEV